MRIPSLLLATIFLFFSSTGVVMAKKPDAPGAVYTMTNSDTGNEVLVFDRSADGSLSPAGTFETGGLGTGGGLGNQGGLLLTTDNQWLYVVNAGSDSISVFKVKQGDLEHVGSVDSGGMRPISLTINGDLLYVLNAGGTIGGADNISGFQVNPDGMLEPLEGSTQPLSTTDTAPAQVSFSTDGNVLVVAEKGTSRLNTYVVDENGIAGPPTIFDSAGTVPFGFSFSTRNRLYVSEAGTSSVSSYQIYPDGQLETISGVVGNAQAGVCWVAVTQNGRYAYTTNAGSGTISLYDIDRDGTISHEANAEAVGGVIDVAFSNNSRYLYALSSSAEVILGYQLDSDGLITKIEEIDIGTGANGLAAK